MILVKKMFFSNYVLAISLLLSLSCCKKRIVTEVDEVIDPVEVPELTSTKITLNITFNGIPSKALASPAKLKYGKSGWVSAEWDDNSIGSLQAFTKLKNTFFTDGCGNQVPYTAALAVNGKNQYNNEEIAKNPNSVSYEQMKSLINGGWDIENHSFYHDPTGNFNFGNDRNKNVKELDDLIFKSIKYKLNGFVVPTNYDGFPTAAKNIGYLFSTSQGTFDGFEPGGKPVYKSVQDFDLAPKNFSSFNRIFYDDWTQMEKDVNAAINDIITKQNSYFRFGSHGIDLPIFNRIIDNFQVKTDDRILFVSTREVMEYRLMAGLPITYTLNENKLTIVIDLTELPNRVRWRDLSFLIDSDKKIASVTVDDSTDKVTFNDATGLVNVFRQVKSWR